MRLLLDTNVLLLWIVGLLKPSLIGTHRRLKDFDGDDFVLVNQLATQVPQHISTPHILAEVSNFLGSGPQQMVAGGTSALADYIVLLDEIYTPARDIAATPEFHALGLTDAAIHHLAQSDIRVISMDFHLCNRLAEKGIEAINPRHFRTPNYG